MIEDSELRQSLALQGLDALGRVFSQVSPGEEVPAEDVAVLFRVMSSLVHDAFRPAASGVTIEGSKL